MKKGLKLIMRLKTGTANCLANSQRHLNNYFTGKDINIINLLKKWYYANYTVFFGTSI
ncbi:MAG TPA: hypothetical protein PLN17_07265 [Candidatus Cloacimonas sp.]|jgi:hypothetical protein|nr:hypothetical protein [Candidatus Cloacimonas sp.]HQJ96905.1 hypothetical protein [Candidatus Cloacimonas sp.]